MLRIVLRATAVVAALVCAPAAGAWTWPSGGAVLQPFVFDAAHPYAGGQHRGIDVGDDAGASVLAPAGGVVSFAGSVPTSGKCVTIQTPDGLSVTLVHLGSIAVMRGVLVDEGSVVGTIGPSGVPELTEPYVHLGVRVTA
jgi:murein DD-endopeptidase MepM/ murein hydrolase activator NlpD